MSQLGFTFYPKDWWTSDSFFKLNPFERYIFLELLFMMYSNDGFVLNSKDMVEGRMRTTIKDDVWVKITDLLVKDGDMLTHTSVNKRLKKAITNRENGKKGGAPKGNNNAKNAPDKQPKNNLKTTKTIGCFQIDESCDFTNDSLPKEKQPKQPTKTTQNNPPSERERESKVKEIEIKEKGYSGADEFLLNTVVEKELMDCAKSYFLSPSYSRAIELLCMNLQVEANTVNQLKHLAVAFNDHCALTGKVRRSLKDWAEHFKNWLLDPNRKKITNEHKSESLEARRARLIREAEERNTTNAQSG